MRFKIQIQIGFLAIFLSFSETSLALSDGFEACVTKAAAHDLQAKRAFQTSLRDLIISTKPKFKALAELSAQLQITLAERRAARLQTLVKSDPKRIETHQGIAKFTNFAWSKGEDAALIKQDEAYKKLNDDAMALRAQNNGHADWPKLRAFFRTELVKKADYQKIFQDYSARRGALKVLIASCTL